MNGSDQFSARRGNRDNPPTSFTSSDDGFLYYDQSVEGSTAGGARSVPSIQQRMELPSRSHVKSPPPPSSSSSASRKTQQSLPPPLPAGPPPLSNLLPQDYSSFSRSVSYPAPTQHTQSSPIILNRAQSIPMYYEQQLQQHTNTMYQYAPPAPSVPLPQSYMNGVMMTFEQWQYFQQQQQQQQQKNIYHQIHVPYHTSNAGDFGSFSHRDTDYDALQRENYMKRLFAAALAGDLYGMDQALSTGLSINLMDPVSSDTPLMMACRAGKVEVVRYCLQRGAKNDPHPDFGQTALHAAVAANQFTCAKAILEEAANSQADTMICNLTDPRLQTPLHVACSEGNEEICILLLNHGASFFQVDVSGMTCLHLSSQAGHKACVAILLDHGADESIGSVDLAGNTSLHLAAGNGHLGCVRLLVESAADVNCKNYAGLTPYMLCTKRGHHQISLVLLKYHSEPSQQQAPVATPKKTDKSRRGGVVAELSSSSLAGSIIDRNAKKNGLDTTPKSVKQNPYAISDDSDDGNTLAGVAIDMPLGNITEEDQPVLGRVSLKPGRSPVLERALPRPHITSPVVTDKKTPLKTQYPLSPPFYSDAAAQSTNLVRSPLVPLYSAPSVPHPPLSPYPFSTLPTPYSQTIPISSNQIPSPPPVLIPSSSGQLYNGLLINPTIESPETGRAGSRTESEDDDYDDANDGEEFQVNTKMKLEYSDSSDVDDLSTCIETITMSKREFQSSSPVATEPKDEEPLYSDPLEVFDYEDSVYHVYVTTDGYTYYLDMGSGHSQWDDPRVYGVATDEYAAETDQVDTTSTFVETFTDVRKGRYDGLNELESKLRRAAEELHDEDSDEDEDADDNELKVKKVLDFGEDNDTESDALAEGKSFGIKNVAYKQESYNDWDDLEVKTGTPSSTPQTPNGLSRKGRPPPIIVSPYQEQSRFSAASTPYKDQVNSMQKQSPRKRSPGQVSPFSSALNSSHVSPRNCVSPSPSSTSHSTVTLINSEYSNVPWSRGVVSGVNGLEDVGSDYSPTSKGFLQHNV